MKKPKGAYFANVVTAKWHGSPGLPAWMHRGGHVLLRSEEPVPRWARGHSRNDFLKDAIVCSADGDPVGVWDEDSLELGFFLTWETLRNLWPRFVARGLPVVGRGRSVLAPWTIRETGDVPEQPGMKRGEDGFYVRAFTDPNPDTWPVTRRRR